MDKQNNIEKLAQWLNQKWKDKISCPVCKENGWELYEHLWELRQFNKSGFIVGGPIIPLGVITCKNCGFTMHFNAIKAGLVSRSDTVEPIKEK